MAFVRKELWLIIDQETHLQIYRCEYTALIVQAAIATYINDDRFYSAMSWFTHDQTFKRLFKSNPLQKQVKFGIFFEWSCESFWIQLVRLSKLTNSPRPGLFLNSTSNLPNAPEIPKNITFQTFKKPFQRTRVSVWNLGYNTVYLRCDNDYDIFRLIADFILMWI